MAEQTVAQLLGLTEEEIAWLERRKTDELTPRQMLRVNEIQSRAWLMTRMADVFEREDLLEECLAFRTLADQVTEATPPETLQALGAHHMALHQRICEAAKEFPR